MLNTILDVLKKNNIEKYLITTRESAKAELYFVKKELDMRRRSNIKSYAVSVYCDFEKDGEKFRGQSEVSIFPEMTAEEVDKAIASAYYAASFVENKHFELVKGEKQPEIKADSKLGDMEAEDIANEFVKAFLETDCREKAFVNSIEFFVEKDKVAILNSDGVDVSYTREKITGEFVVQCKEPQDVELYYQFSYRDLDLDTFKAYLNEALDHVDSRANAKDTPAGGTYDIILSGPELGRLFDMYDARANAAYIYPGYSPFKVGDAVQGEEIVGEKINLTLVATDPYSSEGIPMKDTELVKDGVLKAIHGVNRFSQYIDVEPTGAYNAIRVDNGTKAAEELKKKPYLMPVAFSDFQMDALSGFFGGEIRLAYLYDGETVTPVSGGSITGNLNEAQKDLEFSTERYKDSRYDVPMYVRIKNISFAGK